MFDGSDGHTTPTSDIDEQTEEGEEGVSDRMGESSSDRPYDNEDDDGSDDSDGDKDKDKDKDKGGGDRGIDVEVDPVSAKKETISGVCEEEVDLSKGPPVDEDGALTERKFASTLLRFNRYVEGSRSLISYSCISMISRV
jgi:hypothetical protein